MIKKLTILLALVGGFAVADMSSADAAWVYRRVAPVRRIVAPPYPVARRAVVGPRYVGRPYYARPYVAGYAPGYYYGPGFSGGVYFGF